MDQVRIGIIGVGGMGQGHVGYMASLEEVKLTAVCDIDPQTCAEVAERCGVPGFEQHTELLDSGLVDAVLIATPHYFHPPIAVDAFSRGIHVLSEKPIGVTVGAADEMIAAWRRSGCRFGVMYQMRSEPIFRAARRIVEDGRLGELYRTNLTMGWYRTQAYYDSGTWRATWTGEGGGVLLNQAPHLLDIFTWLGGLPQQVTAQVRTRLHDIEVEDEAFALLEYANGAHGYLYASVIEAPGVDRLELCGDRAKLVIQGGQLELRELDSPLSRFTTESEQVWASPKATPAEVELPEAPSGHTEVTRAFCASILRGEPLVAPGEEGLNALELINAIILSGKRGKTVSIPVDRAEYETLLSELRQGSRGKARLREQRVTDPNL